MRPHRILNIKNMSRWLSSTLVQGNLALRKERTPFINHRFDKLIGGKVSLLWDAILGSYLSEHL